MRILLAHGDLAAGGGAEAYARGVQGWLTRQGHAVDTLDIHGLACPAHGTRRDLALLRLGRLPGLRSLHLLKYALVCRALPRMAQGYDAAILSYGEGPALPCPTLTLRHAPALFTTDPLLMSALGTPSRARRAYARAARLIAGTRDAPAGATLANSRWTARAARHADPRLRPVIAYPGVTPLPRVQARRSPFRILALGRMVPNKRLDEAIEITGQLRARGVPAMLDIAGRADTGHARRLMRRHRGCPHVAFHPDASQAVLAHLLARARFGLHCYRQEHFGIAVAEMILAGVLPLVHDGGGVQELVTRRELRFGTPQEAADRLERLVARPLADTDAMVARLAQGPALAGALDFDARIGDALARFLQGTPNREGLAA